MNELEVVRSRLVMNDYMLSVLRQNIEHGKIIAKDEPSLERIRQIEQGWRGSVTNSPTANYGKLHKRAIVNLQSLRLWQPVIFVSGQERIDKINASRVAALNLITGRTLLCGYGVLIDIKAGTRLNFGVVVEPEKSEQDVDVYMVEHTSDYDLYAKLVPNLENLTIAPQANE